MLLLHTKGPWGMAANDGFLYVASFGSDQVLVFDIMDNGKFVNAFGDSDTLDSPEGIAISRDKTTLYVASFLDSRIVAFDLLDSMMSKKPRTILCGKPVDLDYLTQEALEQRSTTKSMGLVNSPHHSQCELYSDMLHGPEGLTVMNDGRLAIASYYNHSVLIMDVEEIAGGGGGGVGGGSLEVFMGPPGTLEGIMAIAEDEDCVVEFNDEGQSYNMVVNTQPCLLIAAYKISGHISKFVHDHQGGMRGWYYAGSAMTSSILHGPSSLFILDDGSAVVGSYDGNSLLLFNATEAGIERELVLETIGRLDDSSQKKTRKHKRLLYEGSPHTGQQQQRSGTTRRRKTKTGGVQL
jgi:hypothetical protein